MAQFAFLHRKIRSRLHLEKKSITPINRRNIAPIPRRIPISVIVPDDQRPTALNKYPMLPIIRRIETQRHVLKGELAIDREVPGEVQRPIAVIDRISSVDRPFPRQVLIRPFALDRAAGLCSSEWYHTGRGENHQSINE